MKKDKINIERVFDCREICVFLSIKKRDAEIVCQLFKDKILTEKEWNEMLIERKII